VGSFIPHWAVKSWPHHDDTAVVLFTSGTEGDPKGVVLTHANILANVEQVRAHIDLYPGKDVLFNPLPTFHCFGLTVGAVMPLLVGIKAVCHPSPLHVKEITKRIRKTKATILLATDTFISQYARASDEGDLATLRLAVCGAERVRDETRQLLRRRCNMEILEGYGVTEAAPVIAANQPGANRLGTVGKLMAGMEWRLEPVEGIPNAGRLFVRGPNVMKGYLKPDQPGVLHPLADGWHDTGDVVVMDEEGFLAIRGRVKRFAKIGGEMVSLAVVENCASALWPDNMHAAVAVADGRKGEQIVLVTDAKEANRAELVAWAQNHGVPELSVPRKIVHVDHVPVLGTGKTDYGNVAKVANDRVAALEAKAAE
jgi:acyl-[acyl-carrier-protein]-phospholipid O-acyltransferase/long-chain-fatty-acid--[acyl-carrier-protein] ligase